VADVFVSYAREDLPFMRRLTAPHGNVPLTLAELHWLPFADGTDFQADVDRLVEVLDTEIDRVHLHTRLVQAREWETRGRGPSLLLRGDELKKSRDLVGGSDRSQAGCHPPPRLS
jgi:hypothetical protein